MGGTCISTTTEIKIKYFKMNIRMLHTVLLNSPELPQQIVKQLSAIDFP